ncbi:unnamed protein product [Alopecurus aequalis]
MEQRKVEEEEEGRVLKEPTDHQREEEEEEGSVLKEPTDQQREAEESSEEPAGRRSEEPTDERKEAEAERSSDEESMALFVHPCSLLRYLVRAFACCLGMPEDSFGVGSAKQSAAAAPASVDSSREAGEADRSTGATTGFYMQEVITRVFAVRRARPPGPGNNPREGSGGNGGHHH